MSTRSKWFPLSLLVFVVAGAWAVTSTFSSLQADGPAPANDTILKEEMKADLFFLASDTFKGRIPETMENELSAEFIRSRFERLGLKPAGPNGSYYQPYNMMRASLGEDNLLEVNHGNDACIRLRPGQDYYPHRFSASGQVRGSLVYVGFGITAPKLDYDDYRDTGIEGKIALVLDHEPGENDPESPFDGVVRTEYSQYFRKALFAQEAGAIGVLFVRDVHNHPGPYNFEASAKGYWPEKPGRRERYRLATWVEKIRIPAAQVSPALAEVLLRGTGRSLEELSRSAETDKGMKSLSLPDVEIDLTTSVNRHVVPDRNVVALIEGSDAGVKDEWVIVCAHYDHLGAEGDRVFNGADDDGSGIVGLLEIAEAYALAARDGQKPRRSVLFAAWNSEELGLLGAWAYAEKPLSPLDKTVAVLNMDMIGRNEEVPEGMPGWRFRGLEVQTAESNRNSVNLIGHTFSTDLTEEVEKANAAFGLDLKKIYDNNVSNTLRRSDHWPFLQNDVPALWFLTGFHPDYHTEFDVAERINYEKMETIVRLIHQTSWNLAQNEGRPRMSR
jgi:hypothetical protein